MGKWYSECLNMWFSVLRKGVIKERGLDIYCSPSVGRIIRVVYFENVITWKVDFGTGC